MSESSLDLCYWEDTFHWTGKEVNWEDVRVESSWKTVARVKSVAEAVRVVQILDRPGNYVLMDEDGDVVNFICIDKEASHVDQGE